MATHSSILAWRIRGIGEPGGLPSMNNNRSSAHLESEAPSKKETNADLHFSPSATSEETVSVPPCAHKHALPQPEISSVPGRASLLSFFPGKGIQSSLPSSF